MCGLACGRLPGGNTQLPITLSSCTALLQPPAANRVTEAGSSLLGVHKASSSPGPQTPPSQSAVSVLMHSVFHFFQRYRLLLFFFFYFYSGKISNIHKSRENSMVNDHDPAPAVTNSYPILLLLYFPILPPPPNWIILKQIPNILFHLPIFPCISKRQCL